MEAAAEGAQLLLLEAVPSHVRDIVRALERSGHPAFLVGGCVRDLLQGQTPEDYDITTGAAPETLLALFPRAIPIGLRHGTVMIPTPGGPVDITTFRGATLEEDLAHRDFTLNALAYDPSTGRLFDPFDGRTDLAKGRLRAVGRAVDRFDEDPLRALRAARLMATLELELDPELEAAMASVGEGLTRVARERVRHELCITLLAPGVEPALELLRRSGIEAQLLPGAAPDAPALVARLPADLELRLAAWLRGARAGSILRRLRFSRRRVDTVERLLRDHPVEAQVDPARDASVRRLLKRAGPRGLRRLLALRRAELGPQGAAPARARLDALEAAIERVESQGTLALRRHQLALDGSDLMRLLGREAGPWVGRALRFLTDQVIEDPSRNTPKGLRGLLEAWAERDNEQAGR